MDIKVSVVMAAYNSHSYIQQTIECLLNQTLREIEIIAIDDNSQDDTLNILLDYQRRDDRIIVLKHEEDTPGAAVARNIGIAHAKGEYLAILDADDIFMPTMLESAYNRARENNSDIVIWDLDDFDNKTNRTISTRPFRTKVEDREFPKEDVFFPGDYSKVIFDLTTGAAWNKLFRREYVIKNGFKFESLPPADDFNFSLPAMAMANKIVLIREKLMLYRVNNSKSLMGNMSPIRNCILNGTNKLQEDLKSYGLYEKYLTSFVRHTLGHIMFYFQSILTYDEYVADYKEVQDTYLKQWDILSVEDEQLENEEYVFIRKALKKYTASEFMLMYLKTSYSPLLLDANMNLNTIPKGASVAVYGAGNKGKNMFLLLLQGKKYKISCWGDINYKDMLGPVISPDAMMNYNFDYIVIAIADKTICQRIREDLINRGVAAEHIYQIIQ